MAKRKFNQKARALQPAVMKLHFAAAIDSINYIDISQCVSRLNRRFYRQGLNWAVANVKVTQQPGVTATAGSTAYVNSLPHTWTTANAWLKAFHAWKNQQDAAVESAGAESVVARFRDFKISMESGHVVGVGLSPQNLGHGRLIGPFQTGLVVNGMVDPSEEWTGSQIAIPNDGAPGVTNEYTLHMVGELDSAIGNSKGIIQGYALSRSYPQSPDLIAPGVVAGWMAEMIDVGDDSGLVISNAEYNNNELPYDQDEYPGGETNFIQLETQGYNWNQSTVGVNTFNTGPFTAPCGLLRVDFNYQSAVEGSTGVNIITVELVPGNHRGYLCETMEEF